MIDSHCHFDFSEFDQDRDTLWQQCRAQGTCGLLLPGVSADQWSRAMALCARNEDWYCSAGVHPWYLPQVDQCIDDVTRSLEQTLLPALNDVNCVAVGECGLDKPFAQKQELDHFDRQCLWFEAQVAIAEACNMPLIIHAVKAHHEVTAILKRYNLPAGGVMHGFAGSYKLAQTYWRMGFRLGIGGTITYKRAVKTRDAVKRLPLEALLLETDAPSMPLAGHQGERNSPAFLRDIATELAGLRGESLEQVCQQTSKNFELLFGRKCS